MTDKQTTIRGLPLIFGTFRIGDPVEAGDVIHMVDVMDKLNDTLKYREGVEEIPWYMRNVASIIKNVLLGGSYTGRRATALDPTDRLRSYDCNVENFWSLDNNDLTRLRKYIMLDFDYILHDCAVHNMSRLAQCATESEAKYHNMVATECWVMSRQLRVAAAEEQLEMKLRAQKSC